MARLLLRTGGLMHRFGRWNAAARVYALAARTAPRSPEPAYRLGVARHRAGDLEGARAAFTTALDAGAVDRVACLRRRAAVNRRLKDVEALAVDLEHLVRARPGDTEQWRELALCQERLGRYPELVYALDGAAAAGEESFEELVDRARLKTTLADWAGALELYRAAMERRPDDLPLKVRVAAVADRLYRVPFRLDGDAVVPADEAERRSALDEGVELLRQACADPARVWAPYRLGRFYEASGRSQAAAEAYQRAVDLAEAADKTWSEVKMTAWGFRRDFVRGRPEEVERDERLAMSVHGGAPIGDLADAAGFCDVSVARFGLAISGFVLHGVADTITVHVDGTPVLSTTVNHDSWVPTFHASLKHPVVATLPPSSTIAVTAGGRPLVTSSGADTVRLDNPHGTDAFAAKRAEGHTVNKKGYWSPPPNVVARRDERVVAAYGRLADFLESRLDRSLFLMYGTLLGCHRDGRLIPGDDDFDVGYVARGGTPKEAKADSIEVMRLCLAAGFDIGVGGEGRPFNVRVDGCELDVNPVWFYRGKAYAFNSHALTPEQFAPPRSVEFAGRKVYLPADAEAFLADNYGPDWRLPKSDFRYHRSKRTLDTMRRAQLVLSELREFRAFAELAREESADAGTFYGWVDEPFDGG